MHSATDAGVFAGGRIPRNPAIPQAGLIRPLIRLLSLPRPHDPSTRLLVRYDLRIAVPDGKRMCATTTA